MPPVETNSQHMGVHQGNDFSSWTLYKCFTCITKLTETKILEKIDWDTGVFDQFLDRLRDFESTEEVWRTLFEKPSLFTTDIDKWT